MWPYGQTVFTLVKTDLCLGPAAVRCVVHMRGAREAVTVAPDALVVLRRLLVPTPVHGQREAVRGQRGRQRVRGTHAGLDNEREPGTRGGHRARRVPARTRGVRRGV